MDFPGKRALIRALDLAVASDDRPPAIAAAIAKALARSQADPAVRLPDAIGSPLASRYARRELHVSPAHGYSLVAMAWAPGQGTPLHDHDGVWGVECIWRGRLSVEDYIPVERAGPRWRFARAGSQEMHAGDTGHLLPPAEYHVVRNPDDRATAISIHVYRRRLERCNVYLPEDAQAARGGGWHLRKAHPLLDDGP